MELLGHEFEDTVAHTECIRLSCKFKEKMLYVWALLNLNQNVHLFAYKMIIYRHIVVV